jgi:poly(A) polymerase
MIGDPETRYREDPVRIIRVVRFAAKLGFTIEPATQRPIRPMSALLANVPLSRLFDEMIKLLQTGHALASIEELKKQGLGRGLFPVLDAALSPVPPAREAFVRLALQDTDRRVAEGRAVAPSFMLACMLWHDVLERWTAQRAAGEPPVPALQQAIDAVFDARIGDISGRGKLAADMREIWLMQPRFERRSANAAASLVDQPRFRAGYDFLRLRADVGEVPAELADWWEDFHLGDDDEREALLLDVRPAPKLRRVPGPGRAAATTAAGAVGAAVAGAVPAAAGSAAHEAAGEEGVDDAEPPAGGAPARKRRRRRRPRGGGGGSGSDGGGSADASAAPGAAPPADS